MMRCKLNKIATLCLKGTQLLLYVTPYLFLWWCMAVLYIILCVEGILINLNEVFGKTFGIFYSTFAVVIIFSVIYVPFFFKRRRLLKATPIVYALSILFIIFTLLINGLAYNIITHSRSSWAEAWNEHPQLRPIICEELIGKYDITGFGKSEVVSFLGKPDNIADGNYIYGDGCDGAGNEIYIIFEDERVVAVDFYYVE